MGLKVYDEDGLLKVNTVGTDSTAIHDDVAGEFAAITLKASPVSGDLLLIEDSAAGNAKKYVTIGSLPAGSEVNALVADGISGIADDQLAVGTGAGTAAYQTLPNGAVAYSTSGGTFSQASAADLTDGVPNSRTITVVGDSNEITVAEGAQDLSANRTFTVGIADNPTLPGDYFTVPTKADPDPTGADGRVYYNTTDDELRFAENTTWRRVIFEGGAFHDSFSDYVAAEHVDWASAGAGTIHTDNYIEGGPGTDTDAIHDNVSGEIAAVALKGTPVSADILLIEDSAASNAKKRITIGSLPGGSGDTHPIDDSTAIVQDPADNTKLLRMDVGGNTTGITGVLATAFTTAKTITFPDRTGTVATLEGTQIFTGEHEFSGTLRVPDSGTPASNGDIATDSTQGQLLYYSGALRVVQEEDFFGYIKESPVSGDEGRIYTARSGAITIVRAASVLRGSSTPSVSFDLRYGTDRSAAGTLIGTFTTTSTTTEEVDTSFTDDTVPANNMVWIELDTVSGTVDEFSITVFFTYDRA